MSTVTADEVRRFIAAHLSDALKENGVGEQELTDDLDLMKSGIIDSIGLIQLVSAIEEHFGIEVDFEGMDAENLTVLGPLAKYIEERAQERRDNG
jgi:acyl carrier protein